MRLFGWLLMVSMLGGCATAYSPTSGRPTVDLRIESETVIKKGIGAGFVFFNVLEVAPVGIDPKLSLGGFSYRGGADGRIFKIEADRDFQFFTKLMQSNFNCDAPFKAKLMSGKSYLLKMNLDAGSSECEVELLEVDNNQTRSMGFTREPSAYVEYYTSGALKRAVYPTRPASNPTFK